MGELFCNSFLNTTKHRSHIQNVRSNFYRAENSIKSPKANYKLEKITFTILTSIVDADGESKNILPIILPVVLFF